MYDLRIVSYVLFYLFSNSHVVNYPKKDNHGNTSGVILHPSRPLTLICSIAVCDPV